MTYSLNKASHWKNINIFLYRDNLYLWICISSKGTHSFLFYLIFDRLLKNFNIGKNILINSFSKKKKVKYINLLEERKEMPYEYWKVDIIIIISFTPDKN